MSSLPKPIYLSKLLCMVSELGSIAPIMMASSSSYLSSASITTGVATSTFSSILSTPSFGHLNIVELSQENCLLWKTQFLPYLRNQQLLGYVDGFRAYSVAAKRSDGSQHHSFFCFRECVGASNAALHSL